MTKVMRTSPNEKLGHDGDNTGPHGGIATDEETGDATEYSVVHDDDAVTTDLEAGAAQAKSAKLAASRLRRIRFPKSRKLLAAIALSSLILVGGGIGAIIWIGGNSLPKDAAFRYGGRVVKTSELDRYRSTLVALYGAQPPKDAGLNAYNRDVAKSYAVKLILERELNRRNIVASDKAAQDALNRMIAESAGSGPDARGTFLAQISRYGINEQGVVNEVKYELALSDLFKQVIGTVKVTDQDVRAMYEKHKFDLGVPEKRRLRNIVVATEGEARAALERIAGGASFATVAAELSMDGATRDKGGDLGVLSRGQLEDGYAAAAFDAKQGALFGPVQTQHGWNIGYVASITPGTAANFADVRADVRRALEFDASLREWNGWLAQRLRAAHVQYAKAYLPSDPNAAPEALLPGVPTIGSAN